MTVLEEPERVEFVETGERFRIGYTLEPVARRTRLSLDFELMRLELHLRPFTGLIRSVAQDGALKTVERIKGLVEEEPPPPGPSGGLS